LPIRRTSHTSFSSETDIEVEDPREVDPTVRELTIEKKADICKHVRPLALTHCDLKRHDIW
jgi:hypothetical protein